MLVGEEDILIAGAGKQAGEKENLDSFTLVVPQIIP
jgi:hypothetical protein